MLGTTLFCAATMAIAFLGSVALTPCDGLPKLKCTHEGPPSNEA